MIEPSDRVELSEGMRFHRMGRQFSLLLGDLFPVTAISIPCSLETEKCATLHSWRECYRFRGQRRALREAS